jgi:phosphopantothenoylcysteine decarboxylase/phosphopantothenate--cysteine ligase
MKQKFDIVILAAAVSDYMPEKSSATKIKSDQSKIIVKLKRAPKIIDQIKKIQKNVFLIGFKAETNLPKEELISKARIKLKESDADLIIANDIGLKKYKKNLDYNNVVVVDSKRIATSGWKNKSRVTRFIRNEIENRIR